MSWCKYDLLKLEKLYFAGWTLAQMGREIGKTPTAINKILTRRGIRPKKQVFVRDQLPPYHFQIEWVNFKTVISYLEAIGTCIIKLNHEKAHYSNKFVVNGEEVTSAKMLYLANRNRVNNNMSTYCVQGITV